MNFDFSKVKLPKKISPCPIIEAIVEFRFISELPFEALFGMLYKQLQDKYKKIEKLPILQLPDSVRSNDPTMIFSPWFRLRSDNLMIQVGPRVFSIVASDDYLGWDEFQSEIEDAINKITKEDVIRELTRFGIRHINFFDNSILPKINTEINLLSSSLKSEETIFRTKTAREGFTQAIQILNNTNVQVANKSRNGSLIDIDTCIEQKQPWESKKLLEYLGKGHKIEKELFFALLKEEFINTLNPEW